VCVYFFGAKTKYCILGGVLLAADYSQLELRMIAYLSNDEKLIKVLNSDGDVFKLITAQWKNIPTNEVTAEQRAQAKQVGQVSKLITPKYC